MNPESKTTIIATAINIIITLFASGNVFFSVIFSGIFLGISKTSNRKMFLIINTIFFILLSYFKGELNGTGGWFIIPFSSLLLASIPLGIMWVIKKFRK